MSGGRQRFWSYAGRLLDSAGAVLKKISSKLNERGRVLVPSFGSADRSEISKKFLSWQTYNSSGAVMEENVIIQTNWFLAQFSLVNQ